MADFKTNIKKIRIQRKLTQKQMAELIGVAERHYQYYEAGAKEPNMTTLKRVVEVLGVSADYLIGIKE